MRDPALSRLPDDAGTLAILRALVRNPLEAIPEGAYRAGCVATRLFGRDLVYVAHPDLVRHVLTDPGTFGQSEVMRRSLAPLLGDGVLTADGPRWRHQRRAAAPAFRNEAALRLLPLMTAAAEAACDRWADGEHNGGDDAHDAQRHPRCVAAGRRGDRPDALRRRAFRLP